MKLKALLLSLCLIPACATESSQMLEGCVTENNELIEENSNLNIENRNLEADKEHLCAVIVEKLTDRDNEDEVFYFGNNEFWNEKSQSFFHYELIPDCEQMLENYREALHERWDNLGGAG